MLLTKLHIHSSRVNLVHRPCFLTFGLKSKLILVSAPAGFGKSTLISEGGHQDPKWLQSQVKISLLDFKYDWSLAFFLFSIHLILPVNLAYKSGYVPKILGILLAIAGFGYLIDTIQPLLYPNFNTGFLLVTFLGEIIFLIWLFIKGGKTSCKLSYNG